MLQNLTAQITPQAYNKFILVKKNLQKKQALHTAVKTKNVKLPHLTLKLLLPFQLIL